jgi:excisionase family DNA binding protein
MSTNIRIKKVCEFCKEFFVAKTTTTRFCSHLCNSRSYKKNLKDEKIQNALEKTKAQILEKFEPVQNQLTTTVPSVPKELMNFNELCTMTGLSERTMYRLIKDPKFPKFKIGKRLLFKKEAVLGYITFKYGSI